ncbi:hypothetical protein [Nannocystis punicea]|uniref:Immunity protein 53 n=1 Tax=Nannocystis punicea TaxID=2995304 RepID=A0ABY7H9K5_9BACT|nr:hypothetical protein [Nannocystis poenicansa]WAS95954.1 hypothetical protein O0S08_07295 [Nannocystis poenicansa]
MTHRVEPGDVRSPRDHWHLKQVVYQGDPESFSVATGEWDGKPCLALRWNANDWRPLGNPSSSGHPTWFIVPSEVAFGIASDTLRLLAHSDEPDASERARSLAEWVIGIEPPVAGLDR